MAVIRADASTRACEALLNLRESTLGVADNQCLLSRCWGRLRLPLLVVLWLQLITGCATLPGAVPRVPTHAIVDGNQTTLGTVFAAQAAEQPALSGFQVMASGHMAFAARAALADAAERTLDLQYYSVGNDLTTDLLLLRIVRAAERGVRVRVLLDDIHPSARAFGRRAMGANPGIEVRLFNPFYRSGGSSLARLGEFAVDGERLNRRMHNKLWVTDNVVAIVGSRNLGDEYFDASDAGNFSDVDLLAVGPVVRDVSQAFDAYWNSPTAVPLAAFEVIPDAREAAAHLEALRARAAACRSLDPCRSVVDGGLLNALRAGQVSLTWAKPRFTFDLPDEDKPALVSGVEHGWVGDRPGGARTRNELLIVSPYFVPGEDGRRHLAGMRERGIRVAVLTNSLASTDSVAAHAGYARHRPTLLGSGVELYESRPEPGAPHRRSHRWGQASPASLHAKFIVQDRVRVIVGSFNQDPRSRLHNTEAWMEIDSPELALDLAALFEEASDLHHAFKVGLRSAAGSGRLEWVTDEGGRRVRHGVEPITQAWLRLWRMVLGAVIPEHQL
jgi:cardiolipin synthase C